MTVPSLGVLGILHIYGSLCPGRVTYIRLHLKPSNTNRRALCGLCVPMGTCELGGEGAGAHMPPQAQQSCLKTSSSPPNTAPAPERTWNTMHVCGNRTP